MSPHRRIRRRHFRRGSAYIVILGTAMIITVIGISAITLTRVQIRSANWVNDAVKARTCAQTGMQWALYKISSEPDWRTARANGQWVADQVIDDGTFTVWVTDPVDGDLADSISDPIRIKVGGYMGKARQMIQLECVPDVKPLEALSTCLHAAGNIELKGGGSSFTVSDAPLSTNADLDNEGTVSGEVEANTISRVGIITGTTTVPAPPKHAPDPKIFDTYKSLATVIPFPGDIKDALVTPGTNPFGATNADGVYYIDTGGSDIHITRSRIHGTLVISCPGKKVFIEDKVLLHNAREDYPVLIVDGNVEIKLKSDSSVLSEAESGNMNPPGSPYEGASDVDAVDVYPSEIVGLVHVRGMLEFKEPSVIKGVVICEGNVITDKPVTVIHEPKYAETPPSGYIYADQMKISPGSWKQVMP